MDPPDPTGQDLTGLGPATATPTCPLAPTPSVVSIVYPASLPVPGLGPP